MPGMVPASAQPSAMRSAKNCQRVRISAQQAATAPQATTRLPSQRRPPSLSSTMLLGTCTHYHAMVRSQVPWKIALQLVWAWLTLQVNGCLQVALDACACIVSAPLHSCRAYHMP